MELKNRSFTSKEPHVAREPQVADPCSSIFNSETNMLITIVSVFYVCYRPLSPPKTAIKSMSCLTLCVFKNFVKNCPSLATNCPLNTLPL